MKKYIFILFTFLCVSHASAFDLDDISTPYFNQHKGVSYDEDYGSENIEKIGVNLSVNLVENKGNIYFYLKFCNDGLRDVNFLKDVFKRIERDSLKLFLNGRLLRGKYPSIMYDSGSLTLKKNSCLDKLYNLTRKFGLYKVKGFYSAYYHYPLGVRGEHIGGKYIAKAKAKDLLVD